MTDEKDLVIVVNGTAFIENLLNQVIENFCFPRRNRFFWNVVLDSSIMPMASKIKVSMAIAQELKFDLNQNALHKVISLRNAFALHKIGSHPALVSGESHGDDSVHCQLQVIINSSKISSIYRQDALAEFKKYYTKAKDSLNSLLENIKYEKKDNRLEIF